MGVIGAGISINGPSGIDTASLVDQLTALEQQKVTDVQDKVTTYKTQITAYGKLQSALSTILTAAKDLNSYSSFDLFKSDSSDSDVVTLAGGAGAIEGYYDIRVAQLAGSEKMISKSGLISSQSASLSSLGIHVGDISIDGTTITIGANDTIQDLRMKINGATDATGQKLNVSASVIQVSANNFRLVLTSKNTGSQGVSYRDVSGSTLQDLGFINDSVITGNAAQVITSQSPILDAFNALQAGATIQYSGTDHNGNAINGSFTKATALTSINDFLTQMQTDFGTIAASMDGSGDLVLTDGVIGASQLGLASVVMTDAGSKTPATYTAAVTTSGSDGQASKGNTVQTLASADNIQTAFNALSVGSTITYAGVDHNGNAVSNSFIKSADATIDDFLGQVQQSFLGTVDVSVDSGSGKLMITDKTAGSSQLALTALTTTDATTKTATAHAMDLTVMGKEGAGVLSVGKDAFYSLDTLTMTSADNSVENVIAGTTIELHKASAGETVQTTLTRDTDAIKAKLQKLVDAYNALQTFVTDETKMADPNDSSSKAGELAGDTTVKNILDRIRQQLMQPSVFAGESYNSLTMIGVKTDATTGQMSIDDAQFTKAISSNFDEVEHFFVTTGIGGNSTIVLGRKTSDTQSGTYNLRETNAEGNSDSNYLSIQLAGSLDNPWYTSDIRNGDIVTFSSGPAKGLSLTSPSGTIGPGATTSFTFSVGLGDGLSDLINGLTDPNSGIIAEHKTSLNDQISEANSRADSLQTRVNDYHDRLVKQFAAMEMALNTMKNQMQNMLSALGTTTTSA